MCGIAGILRLDGHRIPFEALEAMTEAIEYRGPDDHGFWQNGQIGLGHRRLSIIDLSDAGRQPMSNENGDVQIVYNGELGLSI